MWDVCVTYSSMYLSSSMRTVLLCSCVYNVWCMLSEHTIHALVWRSVCCLARAVYSLHAICEVDISVRNCISTNNVHLFYYDTSPHHYPTTYRHSAHGIGEEKARSFYDLNIFGRKLSRKKIFSQQCQFLHTCLLYDYWFISLCFILKSLRETGWNVTLEICLKLIIKFRFWAVCWNTRARYVY